MNKDEQLKQIIKDLCDGFNSAVLMFVNKDGSLNVVKEKRSNYIFIVFDGKHDFQNLLNKLQAVGYSIDIDTFRGLIPTHVFLKVDVFNKTVSRPVVVSMNHYHYLERTESITLADVLINFDELVISENKELAVSLCQYNKAKN